MQLKGINFFEQHVEKAVALLFGLALLGVVAWQVLGGSTTVKVNNKDESITDAYRKVEEAAIATDRQMNDPPKLPTQAEIDPIIVPIVGFDKELNKKVAPNEQLAAAIDKGPVWPWKSNGDLTHGSDAPFVEIVIPAPVRVVAAPNMSTVSAPEAASPEVAKILPAAQPYDKASVTVEAVVDGTEIKKALAAKPEGGARPLPGNWWETGTHIVGVVLTREMLKPDGTWTAPEKVPAMPGRDLLVDKLDALNDAESIKNAVKKATDQAEMVRRTPYYVSGIGDAWMAPTERERMAAQEVDKDAEIKTLLSQHEVSVRKIKAWEKQLSDMGHPAPVPGGRPGGGPGGGGGGRPGGPPAGVTPAPPSSDDAARKRIQKNIDTEKEKDAKTKARLRELGRPVEDDDHTNQQQQTTTDTKAKGDAPLFDNSSIRIWAHDVFVERGKTYRYQIAIALTNPYFGHSAAMTQAQADKLAKTGIVRSAASEWTEPVTVDRETYVFFPAAAEDDATTGANARAHAEVYQFKWGYWRRGAGDLEPGDRVAAQIKVPDFSKVMPATPPPGAAPPAPTGGRPGLLPQPPTSPTGPDNPGGKPVATDIPKVSIDVTTPEMIVSVGHGPSKSSSVAKAPAEVFIREDDGKVRVVQPDVEKTDSVYMRVSKSADRGEKELNPPVEKAKPNMPNPNRPDSDSSPPPAAPGGRGGG